MAPSRRQIWTSLSIIYLLTLTAMAGYTLYASNALSLPVPNILSALGLALPPLAGMALEASLTMTTTARIKPTAHIRPFVLQVVSAVFLIYESVLATLAGSHLAPVGSLDCALREQWQDLFHVKDESAIRTIQDQYDCCGFASVLDMAWPFPSANEGHGADACHVRFERDLACLEPWREAERRVAGFLLAVALGVFVWQILFLYIGPDEHTPYWLPSTIHLPRDDSAHDQNSARQIDYPRDEENPRDVDSVAGEVARLNADSRLASHIEGGRRSQTSRLQNEWADEGNET